VSADLWELRLLNVARCGYIDVRYSPPVNQLP